MIKQGSYEFNMAHTKKKLNLQLMFKTMLNKTKAIDTVERYGFTNDSRIDPNKFWLIKDPYLRHIRLKIAWKDVMSFERCTRFRITDDPNCKICGQLETVEHQLWECENAQRIWQYASFFRGKGMAYVGSSLREVVTYNNDCVTELIKSQCFRYLIQLDRSKDLSYEHFASKLRHILHIEKTVLYNQGKYVLAEQMSRYC